LLSVLRYIACNVTNSHYSPFMTQINYDHS